MSAKKQLISLLFSGNTITKTPQPHAWNQEQGHRILLHQGWRRMGYRKIKPAKQAQQC